MAVDLNASLPERIADRIRKEIIAGQFRPGERLTEVAIAAWLGVSNNPVREAFQLLEREGLITKEPRRGAQVREFTADHVRHLYMTRSALDSVAYRLLLADDGIEEGLLEKLKQCVQEHEIAAASGDHIRAIELDLRFHDLIYEMTRAEVLISFWHVLRAQFRVLLNWRLRSRIRHGDRVGHSPEHYIILEDLRQGELESLIMHTRQRYLENVAEVTQALHEL